MANRPITQSSSHYASKLLRASRRWTGKPGFSATQPTVTRQATPANSTLNGNPNSAPQFKSSSPFLTILGGFQPAAGATAFSQPAGVSDGWSVRFRTDAPAFDFVRGSILSQTSWHRILVDGELLTGDDAYGNFTSGAQYVHHLVDYGAAKMRRVEIQFGRASTFLGVNVAPTYSVWPDYPIDAPRLHVVGDSYSDGTGAQQVCGSWARQLAEMLGCTSTVNGISGSGYTVATILEDATRLSQITANGNVDLFVVGAGINDNAAAAGTLQAAVTSYLQKVRLLIPATPMVMLGPFRAPTKTPAQTSLDAMKAGFAAAADARMLFVDTYDQNWQNGTGRVGATTGVGNSDRYISTDGLHPSQDGHDYLASRARTAIVDWLRTLV